MHTPLHQTIEFVKMEKEHKNRWSDLKKEYINKKCDLKKRHCNEKTDLCLAELTEIQKSGWSDDIIKKYLKEKLGLHERQIQERQKLCEEKQRAAERLLEKNKGERESLRKTAQL